MRLTFTFRKIVFLFLLVTGYHAVAQQQIIGAGAPGSADTVRSIRIVQGKSLRLITLDSVTIKCDMV